ncbi:MAG: prolyl oligopeptidase family serine peptidase [Verrucomicrobiaceae bacterium]|nr:prolyl oligopeptidase family serine peptidase [Verrucomicrobiaceae bacterium]
MMRALKLIAIFFLGATPVANAGYPDSVKPITIESSKDGSLQPALFFAPETGNPVPLLVALHTWSSGWQSNYNAPLAKGCIERNWAFIHPDFRGANKNPAACGSDLAVTDIIDAVAWAGKKARIDPRRIYLAGASGGGHMALLMAGRAPGIWAGVSAWVPITDCAAWHRQCLKSGRRYHADLEKSCGGKPGESPEIDAQYRKRSPLTWIQEARNIPLDINAGIHDGHQGSVPISHSLNAYNALADKKDQISDSHIAHFTSHAKVPEALIQPAGNDLPYGEKRQPLWRAQSNKTRVTIFNGGHEMIPEAIFGWLSRQVKP